MTEQERMLNFQHPNMPYNQPQMPGPYNDMTFQNEQDIYNYEKLLLEQDAHLLEEQRYLNRLKNSEVKQNWNVDYHYNKITKPMIQKKQIQDFQENAVMKQRLEAYNNYAQRQMELKKELN
jgi:hypothetical protein